jgi:hypothetical protein
MSSLRQSTLPLLSLSKEQGYYQYRVLSQWCPHSPIWITFPPLAYVQFHPSQFSSAPHRVRMSTAWAPSAVTLPLLNLHSPLVEYRGGIKTGGQPPSDQTPAFTFSHPPTVKRGPSALWPKVSYYHNPPPTCYFGYMACSIAYGRGKMVFEKHGWAELLSSPAGHLPSSLMFPDLCAHKPRVASALQTSMVASAVLIHRGKNGQRAEGSPGSKWVRSATDPLAALTQWVQMQQQQQLLQQHLQLQPVQTQ